MLTEKPGEVFGAAPQMPSTPKAALPRALAENDLFKVESGETYRFLRALWEADAPEGSLPKFAIVISVDGRPAMPKRWLFDELVSKVRSGDYKKLPVQCRALGSAKPDTSDKAAEERRWKLIESLVADDAIFAELGRKKRINERANACQVSPETVCTALKDYWRGGQTKAALQTKYAQGAAKRVAAMEASDRQADAAQAQHAQWAKSAGRKLTDGSAPYRLVGKERAKVRTLAVKLYKANRNWSMRRIHDQVIDEHYSIADSDGAAYQLPRSECPSARQIARLIAKELSLEDRIRRETSDKEYENNHSEKTGTYLSQTHGAGSVYEIDATIVDLWLVGRENRHKIIGKATLYLIIDRYSRLIVGFYLTLDPPSWSGAMEALLSTVADKEELCKRYGAQYVPEAWPATGVVCHILATDRGAENVGNDIERLPKELGIGLDTLPACRATLKGMIECSFRLIHVSLRDNAAGYEDPAKARKRQAKNEYVLDAQLTLDELAGELLDIITMHNLRFHKNMALDGELTTKGVRPIPWEVWNADVERRSGMLRTQDEAFMRRMLLPRGKAKVTQEGILFEDCLYACSKAHREGWFVKAGRNGRFEVDVMYDRRSINQIYVVPDDSNEVPFVADLTGDSLLYKNYSWAEFKAVRAIREENIARADEHNRNLRLKHSRKSNARAAEAERLRKEAAADQPGVSRTSGRAALRRKEASERAAEETAGAIKAQDGPGPSLTSSAPFNGSVDQAATKRASSESIQPAAEVAESVSPNGNDLGREKRPEINPYASAEELLDQLF